MVIVGVGLLMATFFPPVIVALLNRGVFGPDTKPYSPKNEYQPHQSDKDPGFGGWRQYKKHKWNTNFSGCAADEEDKPDNLIHNSFWHAFDILLVIKISIAVTFIPDKKFKFNVLPGLYFTDAYGTEGNPKNAPNAVTLNDSGNNFQSKAAITVKGYNFKALTVGVGKNLEITIAGGTIKNKDNNLQTGSPLNENDVLELNASGKITQPQTANGKAVKLKGTIVVTSSGQPLSTTLNISGGSSNGTVGGTLKLESDPGGKHVTISGGSTLIIPKEAYTAIPDKTENSLKIGDPDAQSTDRIPAKVTGATGLNDEDSFTMYWHLLPSDKYDQGDTPDLTVISPTLMVIIGMGLVYCIYPGIAPGMIVPFYLVDKIETVLLVLTTFPPVIIAVLQKLTSTKGWSPKTQHNGTRFGGWKSYNAFGSDYDTTFYHAFDILMIIKIVLLVIFIYCLHYRETNSY